MPRMSVILEVSKLSGWLNAAAFCRVERRAYGARREVRAAGSAKGGGLDGGARNVQARARPCAVLGQGTGRSARRTCSACS
eukprot:scaffold24516_cov60-Phaeocystis_antarctica.AAC.3